ncbi:hypothetical protein [Paenibacillus sp. GXUN7292]|uniref:hypothetical protein n=1 Tax=Paenibacillus sp. GXUN7292 TaxID=3422499 RepID=UPI003D7D1383
MSLCFYIQVKDQIFVGADSAVTLNGKRSIYNIQKLTPLNGGGLMFLAGTVNCTAAVVNEVAQLFYVDAEDVQRILRNQYPIELSLNPEYEEKGEKDLLSAVVFKMGVDGLARSYTMRSVDNFEIIEVFSPNGIHVSAAGFEANKAHAAGRKLCETGAVDAHFVIRRVFEHVSGAEVGGSLSMYNINRKGTTLISEEKINEQLRFPITKDPIYTPNAHLVAGEVIGSVVQGSTVKGSIIEGGLINGASIFGGSIEIGSGNNVFKANQEGIWAGHSNFGAAPFKVNMLGQLQASNAHISGGNITGAANINVTSDLNAGNNVFAGKQFRLRDNDYGNGIRWGTGMGLEIYIDPFAKAMHLIAPGGVFVNGVQIGV